MKLKSHNASLTINYLLNIATMKQSEIHWLCLAKVFSSLSINPSARSAFSFFLKLNQETDNKAWCTLTNNAKC